MHIVSIVGRRGRCAEPKKKPSKNGTRERENNMNLDEQITLKQLLNIKHALGDTIKPNSYRNHYCVNEPCSSWEKLIELGFATKRNLGDLGGITYFVTKKAIEYLNLRGIK